MKEHHTDDYDHHISSEKSIPWRIVCKKEIEKYTEVGIAVRGGRYKSNLTQKQLATILNMKVTEVREMEYGKRAIDKKMAHKLGEIFNVGYKIFLK